LPLAQRPSILHEIYFEIGSSLFGRTGLLGS
jgi:hypothetical protein